MGLRFQKRIKLLPGVTINVSKSGLSTSLGVKGARVTLGHGKTRTTMGIPGSGISHTSIKSNKSTSSPTSPASHLQASSEGGYSVPPLVAKAGSFLYKAFGWFCAFILFLIVLSLVIQHFTK